MNQNQEAIDSAALTEILAGRAGAVECCGLSGSARAYLIAMAQFRRPMPMLVVSDSVEEARRLVEDLLFFGRPAPFPVLYFPPYHLLPFKFLSYHNETASERIRVLYQLLMNAAPAVVVAPVQALLQQLVPKEAINRYAELILEGEEIDRDRLVAKLIAGGYLRTAIVEEPGDFCVRGGIVDVFSPLYADPLRIELFGERVDSLRFFSATDQRRVGSVAEAVLLPAREAILHPEALADITHRIRLLAAELTVPATQVRKIVTHLSNQEGFPGIESLLPLVYPRLDHFFDYLPPDTRFLIADPDRVEKAAREFEEQAQANYAASRDAHTLCVPPATLYLAWDEVRGILDRQGPVSFKLLDVVKAGHRRPASCTPPLTPTAN
jgi:transcription-repair coupling factor (superfamily II helicase)